MERSLPSLVVAALVVVGVFVGTSAAAMGIGVQNVDNSDNEDTRPAISHVILCTTDGSAPTIGGVNADECPDGSAFVRWEWDGSAFVLDEGDGAGTSVTATEFKEPGEPTKVSWTSSTYEVSGVVIGVAGDFCTRPGDPTPLPDSGTAETCSP